MLMKRRELLLATAETLQRALTKKNYGAGALLLNLFLILSRILMLCVIAYRVFLKMEIGKVNIPWIKSIRLRLRINLVLLTGRLYYEE